MSFQKGVSSSPVELGKGAMKPSALITLGGAESGTVPVAGPPNDKAIPANTPIKISDLSGTYTPKGSGKVTLTAATLTIKALGTTTTCTPSNHPKPSLTLDVKGTGGSGGAAPGAGGAATGGGPPAPSCRRPDPRTPPWRWAPSAARCCWPVRPVCSG